jgi:hypothetical protein
MEINHFSSTNLCWPGPTEDKVLLMKMASSGRLEAILFLVHLNRDPN